MPACSSAAWPRAAIWRTGSHDDGSRAAADAACATTSSSKPSASARTRSTLSVRRLLCVVTLVPGAGRRRGRRQGGHHGDRRHLRVEQGRPRGPDRTVAAVEAMLSLRHLRHRTGARPCCGPRRRPAKALTPLWPRLARFRAEAPAIVSRRRRSRSSFDCAAVPAPSCTRPGSPARRRARRVG